MAKKSKASSKAKDDALFEKFKKNFWNEFQGWEFGWESTIKYDVNIDEQQLCKLRDTYLHGDDYPSLNEMKLIIGFKTAEDRARWGIDLTGYYEDFNDDLERGIKKALEIARFDLGQTRPRIYEDQQVVETSSVRKHQPLAVEKKQAAEDEELEPEFVRHDPENFTSFTFDGKRYDVGPRQGKAIKLLYQAHQSGHPDVPIRDIKRAMGLAQTSNLRDSFRRAGLWNTLITSKRRLTRRLSIFS